MAPEVKPSITAPSGCLVGVPFDVHYTASERYDNLFIELQNITTGWVAWAQVRYGILDDDHGTFTAPEAGMIVARLRQPKYANGHNRWPILAEADFEVTGG